MAAAQDLITLALKSLQAYGSTEPLPPVDANDGLTLLNLMLDSWSLDSLAVYTGQTLNFALQVGVGGTTPYTFGPGGTGSTTRPLTITSAFTRDSNGNDYDVEVVLDQERWDAIGNKSLTSQIVETVYYDGNFPTASLFVWPVPLLNYQLFIVGPMPLTQFTTLQTTVVFPPGYQLAFILNLAELMCSFYGVECPPTVSRLAAEALAKIKRINTAEMLLRVDAALIARPKGTYNIYRDSISRGGYT